VGYDPCRIRHAHCWKRAARRLRPRSSRWLRNSKAPRAVFADAAGRGVTDGSHAIFMPLWPPAIPASTAAIHYRDYPAARSDDAQRKNPVCRFRGTNRRDLGLGLRNSRMIGGVRSGGGTAAPDFETLASGQGPGWGPVGPVGSGHYTKWSITASVCLDQAYAEVSRSSVHKSAFKLDLHQIVEILALRAAWCSSPVAVGPHRHALEKTPRSRAFAPRCRDPEMALDRPPTRSNWVGQQPVLTLSAARAAALRDNDSFPTSSLAAMRNHFRRARKKKE